MDFIVASAGAAVTAIYVFLVAPHLLDPDNMVAPLLFVRLPLFFVHALLLRHALRQLGLRISGHCTQTAVGVRQPRLQCLRDQSGCDSRVGYICTFTPSMSLGR